MNWDGDDYRDQQEVAYESWVQQGRMEFLAKLRRLGFTDDERERMAKIYSKRALTAEEREFKTQLLEKMNRLERERKAASS